MPVARNLRPFGQRPSGFLQLGRRRLLDQALELFQRHFQLLHLRAARFHVHTPFAQALGRALLTLTPVTSAAAFLHGGSGCMPGHGEWGWCGHAVKDDSSPPG